jgi:hypothetical protein
MWKHHAIYESRPCSVIITLGDQLYRVPEAVPNIVVSLISLKKYKKVASQTGIFFLCMVLSEGDYKVTVTAKTSAWGLSAQHQKVDEIVEEYKDIFTFPTMVIVHCQVENPIDLKLGATLPNDLLYRCFVMENKEIKLHIQDLILKGHIVTRKIRIEVRGKPE